MKYLLMIYDNEVEHAKKMTEADLQQEMADYYAFGATAAARTTVISSEALHDTSSATTVRVRDGKTITTDGPFAETKEQLGGYYLLDCKDLDEAIEMAALIPGAKHGSVEIRPCVVFE
jgi:hypothetical protein